MAVVDSGTPMVGPGGQERKKEKVRKKQRMKKKERSKYILYDHRFHIIVLSALVKTMVYGHTQNKRKGISEPFYRILSLSLITPPRLAGLLAVAPGDAAQVPVSCRYHQPLGPVQVVVLVHY
jgi:hypothetical protein